MDTETYEIRKGAIVYKSRPPLDVRIVAYYLYSLVVFRVVLAILLIGGVIESAESHRVLFGTVVLSSSLSDAVHAFLTGLYYLLCAWGLMRRIKWAWWFSLLFILLFSSPDGAFTFPKHQVNAVICVATDMALITWLWFRRELYGVHLAASHTKK